jgi:Ser/Thr protein kinase RdoA (MazF antagonist)
MRPPASWCARAGSTSPCSYSARETTTCSGPGTPSCACHHSPPTRARDELHGWAEAAAEGPDVICHGDLHPANVLVRAGEPVLIDWYQVCLGPPAWDHAALMTWAQRWGGDDERYEAYARGYGTDYRDDPAARLLARVRLLAPTVNMVIRGASDPACAAEATRRLRYWLGDPAAPQWVPQ